MAVCASIDHLLMGASTSPRIPTLKRLYSLEPGLRACQGQEPGFCWECSCMCARRAVLGCAHQPESSALLAMSRTARAHALERIQGVVGHPFEIL